MKQKNTLWSTLIIFLFCSAYLGIVSEVKAQAIDTLSEEAEAKRLVVMISGQLGDLGAYGAGIIFGGGFNRLYVATANHVVRRGSLEAQNLQVEFSTLPGEFFPAKLLDRKNEDLDLAVLAVLNANDEALPVDDMPFGKLGNLDLLLRESEVYPIGRQEGIVWFTPVTPSLVFQKDANTITFESPSIAEGASGGGLFTGDGKLVGMVVADTGLLSRAVRIDRIQEILQGWGYPFDLAAAGEDTPSPQRDVVLDFSMYSSPIFLEGDEFFDQNIGDIVAHPSGNYCAEAQAAIVPQVLRAPYAQLTTASPGEPNRCNTVPLAIFFRSPVSEVRLRFNGANVPYELKAFTNNGEVISSARENAKPYEYGEEYVISVTSPRTDIAWVTFGHETAATMIRDISFTR